MIRSYPDEIVPNKEYKVKTGKPAWLTDELLNLKHDRLFFQKAKITGDEGINPRNRVNIAMRSAKSEYYKGSA